MPRFRPPNADDPEYWDANQVVAYNFRELREKYGWTQEYTAERLERHLGVRLKKASISAIETSVDSTRRRVFNAQELAAFAMTFDVAIVYFLLPPPIPGLKLAGSGGTLTDLWTMTVGEDDHQELIKERLAALSAAVPEEMRSSAEHAHGFSKYVSFEHFEARRFNAGIDMLREKQNELDDLFEKMRATVEEYDNRAHRFKMESDADRKAYSHVSHLVLGETMWTKFLRRLHPDSERFQLGRLIHRDDVPWDTIVDVEDEKVAKALGELLDAIGPNAAEYFETHIGSVRRPK